MRFFILVSAIFIGWCIQPKWIYFISVRCLLGIGLLLMIGIVWDLMEFNKKV